MASGVPDGAAVRPRVSFTSPNIWRRLEACETVARAYGWGAAEIRSFAEEVRRAFSYEDAMAVIAREFDVV